jgi:hypothetical protein
MTTSHLSALLPPVLAFFENKLVGFQEGTKAFVFNNDPSKVTPFHKTYIEHIRSDNPLIIRFIAQIQLSFTQACFDPEGYHWMNRSEHIIHKLEEAHHPPLKGVIDKIKEAQCFYKKNQQFYLTPLTPSFIKKDKEFVVMSLQLDRGSLKDADTQLQDDPLVALTAFENYLPELQFASLRLRSDPEFIVQAIKIHPTAINYADKSILAHPQVVAAILPQFIKNFCFQLPHLCIDFEFMKQAVTFDGFALLRSSPSLKPKLKHLAHKQLIQALNHPKNLPHVKKVAQFIIEVAPLFLLNKEDELYILAQSHLTSSV